MITLRKQVRGVLDNTSIITASQPINEFQRALVDTSGGIVTITLPATPSDGSIVGFLDINGAFVVNNLTIQPSVGHDIQGSPNLVCDIAGAYVELQFVSSINSWRLLSTPQPPVLTNIVKTTVFQLTHGFALGQAIQMNGGTWALAQANGSSTLGVGIVSNVLDVDNFEVAFIGLVSGLAGLTAGEYYFVSDTVAGGLTITEPTTYSNPIGLAISTTELIVLPYRPSTKGSSTGLTRITVDEWSTASAVITSSATIRTLNYTPTFTNSKILIEALVNDIQIIGITNTYCNTTISDGTNDNSSFLGSNSSLTQVIQASVGFLRNNTTGSSFTITIDLGIGSGGTQSVQSNFANAGNRRSYIRVTEISN